MNQNFKIAVMTQTSAFAAFTPAVALQQAPERAIEFIDLRFAREKLPIYRKAAPLHAGNVLG